MDVISRNYDVGDYLDVLRGQMKEEKFTAMKRSVFLSSACVSSM